MPNSQATNIVQRLWSYCNVLRDDGVSYSDYVEQLTYLIFLKMDDEQRQAGKPSKIPEEYNWRSLIGSSGEALEAHYRHILQALGASGTGLIPIIFRKAQNKIQDPAKLQQLITKIDEERWANLDLDVKGEIYEGLLERNAQDVKGGAGQYFTPRPLIEAIVDVMQPGPKMRVADPACGTGGFLLAAYNSILKNHPETKRNKAQLSNLQNNNLRGWEIVDNTARLCVMNFYLHGIGLESEVSPITVGDALARPVSEKFDMVLTNPPFGKKSSFTITTKGTQNGDEMDVNGKGKNGHGQKTNDNGYNRPDFSESTSNKQLNFLQHVRTMLKDKGRAAVIVPDNVLFEGGAGEAIRRDLLRECDVHTLLRLPTGIFYAQGVKANVLFFDNRPSEMQVLWIYDLRTNVNLTKRQNPLTRKLMDEFVGAFKPESLSERESTWSEEHPQGRWRAYLHDELLARDKANLDIFWLRDESLEDNADLPEPEMIAAEIIDDLRAALGEFEAVGELLGVEE